MNILLDKRALKQEAKGLSISNLRAAIDALNDVTAVRQKEVSAIEQLQEIAKEQGFTLEQLGYTLSQDSTISELSSTRSKRPAKPKFKTINEENQYFYIEEGKLRLLKTHTMKKSLAKKGIKVVPFAELDKKQRADVKPLIEAATEQATRSFNEKVKTWNQWAKANNAEILSAR